MDQRRLPADVCSWLYTLPTYIVTPYFCTVNVVYSRDQQGNVDFNHCLLLVTFHDEDQIFLHLDFDLTSYLIAF